MQYLNKFYFLDDVGGNTSTLSSWFVLLIYVLKKKFREIVSSVIDVNECVNDLQMFKQVVR